MSSKKKIKKEQNRIKQKILSNSRYIKEELEKGMEFLKECKKIHKEHHQLSEELDEAINDTILMLKEKGKKLISKNLELQKELSSLKTT